MVASHRVDIDRSVVYAATADAIRGSLFKQQLDVLTDPHRRKAVICPRRAGKSWTAMAYAFDKCLRTSDARTVVCTLTLKHAKNIYWKEIKAFAKHYGLDLQYHLHDMMVTFANGSTIMLIGAESLEEIEKLRGGKYDLVIIDECKSYNPRILEELADDVIWPALGDRLGTVMMIGTPGNLLHGPFYWATAASFEVVDLSLSAAAGCDIKRPYSRTFARPEAFWVANPTNRTYWSRHAWTRADNVTLPHLWTESLETKLHSNWGDDHPTWRREHLGEWVPAVGSYVYAYNELYAANATAVSWSPDEDRAATHGLPEGHDWRFIMGLDLGFEDDYAIVVCAYSMTSHELYHVYDWKQNHQDIFVIADAIAAVYGRFKGFDAMVGDFGGLGTLVVETLNKRFGFNILPALKKEKFDHIELLNADFHAGKIRIIRGSNLDLELRTLQWLMHEDDDKALLARTGKLKENPQQPNHLCDALLYVWRHSQHHYAETPRSRTIEGSPQYFEELNHAGMQSLLDARNEQHRASKWLGGLNQERWFS